METRCGGVGPMRAESRGRPKSHYDKVQLIFEEEEEKTSMLPVVVNKKKEALRKRKH